MIRRACTGKNGPGGFSGFTLIEVLVAIAILGISMSLVFGIFQSVFAVVDHVEDSSAFQRRADVVFGQLRRDVAGMYKGPTGSFQAESDTTNALLSFTTTSELKFDPRRRSASAVQVNYLLETSKNGINYNLYRLEYPIKYAETDESESEGKAILVCERIREFQITYLDRYGAELDEWQARSSSRSPQPEDDLFPVSIRVELELANGPGKEAETKRFKSSFFVRPARLISTGLEGRG